MNNKELSARFWFCLLFSLPFLVPHLDPWIQWILASCVLFVGAKEFFLKSYKAKLNRFTLITLALLLAYLGSFLELLLSSSPTLLFSQVAYWSTAINLGLIFEEQLTTMQERPKEDFLAMLPKKARKLFKDGHYESVSVEALATGDCVRVLEHERIPVDGVIISGTTQLDESFLTGNLSPVTKGFGETVYAGTTNLKEAILVSPSHVAKLTLIAKSAEALPRIAPNQQPAPFFIPIVIILSSLALFFGLLFGSIISAIGQACAFLLVAAPAAFDAKATILSQAVYLGAKQGLIIYAFDAFDKPTIIHPDQKSKARVSKFVNATFGLINQNLFLAYAYNVLALLVVLFATIEPLSACISMLVATLLISLNSSRLANKVS